MSALDDLIQEIADEDLRRRIEKEIATLKGTKKFGLGSVGKLKVDSGNSK